jgi:hypothetical protein
MWSKTAAIVCWWTALLSVGRGCEDNGGGFGPLTAARHSARPRDGFSMSVFGTPDKYIPHSMYIGEWPLCLCSSRSRTGRGKVPPHTPKAVASFRFLPEQGGRHALIESPTRSFYHSAD